MPRKKGDLSSVSRQGTVRGRIWATIRILKRFHYADVEACAEANVKTMKRYITMLERYGYLRREGTHNKPVFILQRDTGPNHPAIYYGKGLRDMNTNEIHTPEDTA